MSAERRIIAIDDRGATVDAEVLADGLGVDAAEVDVLIRQGRLTSKFEKGVGSDAGRSRLTFWIDGKRFQIVVDDRGRVLHKFRTSFGVLRSRRSKRP